MIHHFFSYLFMLAAKKLHFAQQCECIVLICSLACYLPFTRILFVTIRSFCNAISIVLIIKRPYYEYFELSIYSRYDLQILCACYSRNGETNKEENNFQKLPIDSAIQQFICLEYASLDTIYQMFTRQGPYLRKEYCSMWFPSRRCKICCLWTPCSTANLNADSH